MNWLWSDLRKTSFRQKKEEPQQIHKIVNEVNSTLFQFHFQQTQINFISITNLEPKWWSHSVQCTRSQAIFGADLFRIYSTQRTEILIGAGPTMSKVQLSIIGPEKDLSRMWLDSSYLQNPISNSHYFCGIGIKWNGVGMTWYAIGLM